MSRHRKILHCAEITSLVIVLLWTLLCVASCGPCSMHTVENPEEYDECVSFGDNSYSGSQSAVAGDSSQGIVSDDMIQQASVEGVCTRPELFCFPSTLPGFLDGVHLKKTLSLRSNQSTNEFGWSSNYCNFDSLSGGVAYCSFIHQEGSYELPNSELNSVDANHGSSCRNALLGWEIPSFNRSQEKSMKTKPGIPDESSSIPIYIDPHVLDWEKKHLYVPSMAFLTVENTHGENILKIYEPYSTNAQFFPFNFSQMLLGPGEVASVCFVFLPTSLGLSSAHLILQTSAGGFLIQARGFGIKSPYGMESVVGFDDSAVGRWRSKLYMFNPFDETLHVNEIAALISFTGEGTPHPSKAICSVKKNGNFTDKERLDISSNHLVLRNVAIRPSVAWEIGPNISEAILDLEILPLSQAKISGALCMLLVRASVDKHDMIMVPLEAEFGGRSVNEDIESPLAISMEVLTPCDVNGDVNVALLLRNAAHYPLKVLKIHETEESKKNFQIRYAEGLVLFPGTYTQVAVIAYTPFCFQLHDSQSQVSYMNINCKLLLLTNETDTPQIEIPCSDVVSTCSIQQSESCVELEHQSNKVDSGSVETRISGGISPSPLQTKARKMVNADELVLENWISQGTDSGLSVLDDQEILFPFVPAGTHQSKWITINNPSQQPIVTQLILNSAESIDECRPSDTSLQPSSSSNLKGHSTEIRYGFSLGESAITEAYVHPYGKASLGPILFHPSSRCTWKSSALVRNNLSGVEWFSLHGFGGSLSLLLFEGTEPVQTLEFRYSLPSPLNFTVPSMLSSNVQVTSEAFCSQPFLKELYAKNVGDLPLEVNKIAVSGTACGLDGFLIDTCEGFSLKPGESKKLVISYFSDFSVTSIQRDLELALTTGILVVPMKASLPTSLLHMCKRSILWLRVKKSSFIFLFFGLLILLVCYFILPQEADPGSQDYLFKGKAAECLDGIGKGIVEPNFLVNAKREMTMSSSLLSKSVVFERSTLEEALLPGKNLSVKTGKEKGRRRRKKKSSSMGLSGQFEVSSSHSGNSTPSSPLSPFSPKKTRALSPDVDHHIEGRNPFANEVERVPESSSGNGLLASKVSVLERKTAVKCQEKIAALRVPASKPVLLPSATFPSTLRPSHSAIHASSFLGSSSTISPLGSVIRSSSFLGSNTAISPLARAPGSKLYDWKAVKMEEKRGQEDDLNYDIWGDHLFGLGEAGMSKGESVMSLQAAKSNSNSFFARGPQILATMSEANSVSSNQDG